MKKVTIIGGGLAGSEAAFLLANKGINVTLYEMRPTKTTLAHNTSFFGELVCSNSLKSKNLDNAAGLLKAEMEVFDSLIMAASKVSEVPAGNALAVDRTLFGAYISEQLQNHPLITIKHEEVDTIPEGIVVIASGPLTSDLLVKALEDKIGKQMLSFFDASAPIVTKESIDMNKAYFKSRYEQDDAAYLNCAFTKEEYEHFYHELINAKIAPLRDFDTKYFDGCMPVEVMAKRGINTLRFGPLKPRGLRKDENHHPYAVLQLRQDNVSASLYNLVGFQTNLTYSEQARVFSLIPGLENAEFMRYGLMHRNTYINAPRVLNEDSSLKTHPNIYIAGQLSGVEGYVESAASGIYVALNIYARLNEKKLVYPDNTMMGSLMHYIVRANPDSFNPMNANFGIFVPTKKDERLEAAVNAIEVSKKVREDLFNE